MRIAPEPIGRTRPSFRKPLLLGACLFSALLVPGYVTAQTPPALWNVSTRGVTGPGDEVLTGGFIIQGTAPRTILIRAIGPSLAEPPHNLSGALSDPLCILYAATGEIQRNDDWTEDATQAAAIRDVGLQPTSPRESAILRRLDPGGYTVQVAGKQGARGLALVEIFDLDSFASDAPARTFNLSTRGRVGTGNNIMILGLIIRGEVEREFLFTGIGASLAEQGVSNALADPTLELYDQAGAVIARSDDWFDSPDFDAIAQTGFSPRDPLEPALLVRLRPGAYTAMVRGSGNSEGIALPEVYDFRALANVRFSPDTLADQTARLVVPSGSTPETLSLRFVGDSEAAVGTGAAGTYAYRPTDDFRAEFSVTASGYTLTGRLQFYRPGVAIYDGSLRRPGGASETTGGILVLQ